MEKTAKRTFWTDSATDAQFELLEQFRYLIERVKYYKEQVTLEDMEHLEGLYHDVLNTLD